MHSLPDRWIWDFWLARHGDDHHVFYLQAPKSIGNPDARHWNVSVGHAVSRDYLRFQQANAGIVIDIVPGKPFIVRHSLLLQGEVVVTFLLDGKAVRPISRTAGPS